MSVYLFLSEKLQFQLWNRHCINLTQVKGLHVFIENSSSTQRFFICNQSYIRVIYGTTQYNNKGRIYCFYFSLKL